MKKKCFRWASGFLVVVLLLSFFTIMVMSAQPTSVTADITDPAAISVDISWDSMEFTYTAPSKGTWNPETHQYEKPTAGGWTTDGGNITVTNNGDIGVAAHFSFTLSEGMSGISGSFTASLLTVDAGKADSTILTLSGTPEAEFESETLGTVNVSIKKYGWLSLNGKFYYYDDTGTIVTGWKNHIPGWEDKWFYFDDDTGTMCTGWKNDIPGWEGKWFYFNSDGTMCTGWKDDIPGREGECFYFDDTGTMCTGWVEIDGKWYYFNETGQMVKSSADAPNE